MLDQIMNLVREHSGQAIVNNPAIPNERNEEAIQQTSQSIFDNLKSQASSGGLQGIMSMFQGGGQQSGGAGGIMSMLSGGGGGNSGGGVMSAISGGVAGDLMSKFGLDASQAQGIIGQIMPGVMSKLVQKTNDPNDKSIDIQGVISSLTGGGGGGGGFDMGSITKLFGN